MERIAGAGSFSPDLMEEETTSDPLQRSCINWRLITRSTMTMLLEEMVHGDRTIGTRRIARRFQELFVRRDNNSRNWADK